MIKKLRSINLHTGVMNGPGENIEVIKPGDIDPEVRDWEERLFLEITNPTLDEIQKREIVNHGAVFPGTEGIMAVHWHPEHVPIALASARIKNMFPDSDGNLIIPTQHNEFMGCGGYFGAEIDCFSASFDRKVQLLIHLRDNRMEKASGLRRMAAHTGKYRAGQMFDILAALESDVRSGPIQNAIIATEAEPELLEFTGIYSRKLRLLLEKYGGSMRQDFKKNKLIRDFFDGLRERYDSHLINLCQIFIKAVKETVKSGFSTDCFFRTEELIEEARSAGAGIIVPHPEQFWPVLLADYDVDGYEVWNPQSSQYTDFLIEVMDRQNKNGLRRSKPLLVFMGDDTHLGEKVRKKEFRDCIKASREIGLQPAWEDTAVKQALAKAGMSKRAAIMEYRERLDSY